MDSKAKGKRFELECCETLSEVFGTKVERTGQYCAKSGTADLVVPAHPWMHWEAKMRGESITPAKLAEFFDRQAFPDAAADGVGKIPLVASRWNRSRFLMVSVWAWHVPDVVDLLAPSRGWVRP